MTTFIKTKFKISDINKYKLAANITEYHIISKLILLRIIINPVIMIIKKMRKCNKTRMTTFIKTKFNKSDDQTNIDNIE